VLVVPLVVIGVPMLLLEAIKKRIGTESKKQQEQLQEQEHTSAHSLLLLKVTAAQVLSTIIVVTWFVGFYTQQKTWNGYMGEVAGKICLSFDFFSFDFYFSFAWPSSLHLSFRLPLAFSLGVLAFQYGMLAFKWMDQRKIFDWGEDTDESHEHGGLHSSGLHSISVPEETAQPPLKPTTLVLGC
jgi:hypothetical protein